MGAASANHDSNTTVEHAKFYAIKEMTEAWEGNNKNLIRSIDKENLVHEGLGDMAGLNHLIAYFRKGESLEEKSNEHYEKLNEIIGFWAENREEKAKDITEAIAKRAEILQAALTPGAEIEPDLAAGGGGDGGQQPSRQQPSKQEQKEVLEDYIVQEERKIAQTEIYIENINKELKGINASLSSLLNEYKEFQEKAALDIQIEKQKETNEDAAGIKGAQSEDGEVTLEQNKKLVNCKEELSEIEKITNRINETLLSIASQIETLDARKEDLEGKLSNYEKIIQSSHGNIGYAQRIANGLNPKADNTSTVAAGSIEPAESAQIITTPEASSTSTVAAGNTYSPESRTLSNLRGQMGDLQVPYSNKRKLESDRDNTQGKNKKQRADYTSPSPTGQP